MSLFVDTSAWSLLLRRDTPTPTPLVDRLLDALRGGDEVVATTGLVLQELLQGVLPERARTRITTQFAGLSWIRPDRSDHVLAAEVRNDCRRAGVQLGTVDALLAALCLRRQSTLLTADRDFLHAARVVDLRVWAPT